MWRQAEALRERERGRMGDWWRDGVMMSKGTAIVCDGEKKQTARDERMESMWGKNGVQDTRER